MGSGLRGAVAAWLGLIALHAVGTQAGSGRVAGLFKDLSNIAERVLDPTVPAIPDLRTRETEAAASTSAPPAAWKPGGWAAAGTDWASIVAPVN